MRTAGNHKNIAWFHDAAKTPIRLRKKRFAAEKRQYLFWGPFARPRPEPGSATAREYDDFHTVDCTTSLTFSSRCAILTYVKPSQTRVTKRGFYVENLFSSNSRNLPAPVGCGCFCSSFGRV